MDQPRRSIVLPRERAIRVGCRGELVFVQIGDVFLRTMGWREAIRTGYDWLREGKQARAGGRPAELKHGHNRLDLAPDSLIRLAGWLIAKGYVARRRSGNEDLRYDP